MDMNLNMDIINKYIKGNGIDTSTIPNYFINARWFYQTPSNLYRPAQFIKEGSLDFVYCNSINESKFYKILLKEWFDLLKIGGYLVLFFRPNRILSKDEVLFVLNTLFGKMLKVIEDKHTGDVCMIIVRKMSHSLRILGSIDSWTFGIITGGTRPDNVKAFVESVRRQKIPNYEIIIGGNWQEGLGEDVIVLNQAEAASKGHITKMKNVICKKAKYENIIIVHDRVVLSSDWFKGMKLYGNNFEIISCSQVDENNNRAGDWITVGGPLWTPYKSGALEYDDWDEYAFASGTVTVIKKSIWKKFPWNEKMHWNQGEDIELSLRLGDNGFVTRINPYAVTFVNNWRHGLFPLHKRNSKKLGSKQGAYLRRLIWFFLRVTNSFPYAFEVREWLFKKYVSKSRLKSFIVNH